MRAIWSAAALVAVLAVLASGCGGPPVDLTKGLQVVDMSSGWLDVGIVDGQNKIVPTISFKLKNNSDRSLNVLQVNVLFRRGAEKEEWGSSFMAVVGSEGLAPGATSKGVTATSQQGYKSTEPRADMLTSQYFVDAKAEVLAKYAANEWQKLDDYPITRQLITR